MPETKSESLTAKEAAEFAKVGIRTIYEALDAKRLQGTFFGGSRGWVTTKSAVNKWAKDGFETEEKK